MPFFTNVATKPHASNAEIKSGDNPANVQPVDKILRILFNNLIEKINATKKKFKKKLKFKGHARTEK